MWPQERRRRATLPLRQLLSQPTLGKLTLSRYLYQLISISVINILYPTNPNLCQRRTIFYAYFWDFFRQYLYLSSQNSNFFIVPFRTRNMTFTFGQIPATRDTGETVLVRCRDFQKWESFWCLPPIFTFHCMRPESFWVKLRNVQFHSNVKVFGNLFNLCLKKSQTWALSISYIRVCVDRVLCV